MGWLFPYGMTRAALIKERTQGWANDRLEAVCLKHALRGNVLWTVWEHRYKDGSSPFRFIGCDLLRYDSADKSWGYKTMDESVAPCYYTCPLSFLAMTPPLDEDWRAAVRAYHARIRRTDLTLRVGMTAHPPVRLSAGSPDRLDQAADRAVQRDDLPFQAAADRKHRGRAGGEVRRVKAREAMLSHPASGSPRSHRAAGRRMTPAGRCRVNGPSSTQDSTKRKE
jgi:hypothetical protein